ncbi:MULTISPECIES: acyl-CoA dehydrogenase family protein [unclassified Caulobacter]|uniref:acyl-CoA dehydrogenase family protein n=1 Tax=unclassified Caulobacter TaxID=2648921 RepID=UPI0006F6CA0D|nr:MULTISPECIES: acyl-CoA dehydrogenase family protein [unclassified Caulobacter]KQV54717.1 acyl-CoA dehydrogenase [Caulobacter sp. Root342]KQV64143.1 acyl-CoA dehydrogenase [Caulobacter sp. Root343]
MDFTLTPEQILFGEVVAQVLDDHCNGAALRRLMASGQARDPSRWGALSDTGAAGVLVAEDLGGLGLAEIDFLGVAQACGHAGLPEPLVEHAGLATPLLARAGGPADLLDQALSGQASLAIGHPINPFVADADTAAALLLEHEGEVHLVRADQAQLIRQDSVDPFRRLFRVGWTPSADTRLLVAAEGASAWDQALDRGALFAAAQMLGLAQKCVDLSVAYAKERQQFGKPIGTNQAIKHLLANVQVRIEFARPVLQAAAAHAGRGDLHAKARISHAKLAADAACDLAARTAVQIHGAMGFSWEVDVHFFLKRGLALSHAWGGPDFHRARVTRRMLSAPLGPDQTFAQGAAHG